MKIRLPHRGELLVGVTILHASKRAQEAAG